MKNTLHTAGPWRVVCSSAHNNPQTTRKDILGQSQFGPAYVAGDISEIDARLISAAPDLLSALQQMLNADYAIQEGFGEKSDQAMMRISAIDSAHRAIAKAKGAA